MKSKQWTVTNVYGIRGETNHRTPEAALKEAKKREGEGWIVLDDVGNQWGRNGDGDAVVEVRWWVYCAQGGLTKGKAGTE